MFIPSTDLLLFGIQRQTHFSANFRIIHTGLLVLFLHVFSENKRIQNPFVLAIPVFQTQTDFHCSSLHTEIPILFFFFLPPFLTTPEKHAIIKTGNVLEHWCQAVSVISYQPNNTYSHFYMEIKVRCASCIHSFLTSINFIIYCKYAFVNLQIYTNFPRRFRRTAEFSQARQ